MRILITGACGFLGHHIVEHFLKSKISDLEIVVLDKLSYASRGFDRLREIDAIGHPRVHVIGHDLALPVPPGVAQEIGEIDYVIHAAAETHVDNSIIDPLPFYQSNVIGTHNLLWMFKQQMWQSAQRGPRRIFLVSTDEVYGPAAWDAPGNTELDPFRPANPYAAAKAGGEAIGMAYANTYKLPVTILNTMNLYGERQHFEKYIPLVIRKVLRNEMIDIHADPERKRAGTRYYIHCRNFASAIAWLIERDTTARKYALDFCIPLKLHVAGEREISNLQLAEMIATIIEKPLVYRLVDFHSSRPGHDLRYALNDGKIRSMGWHNPVNTDDSLAKTVNWYLHNRQWLGQWP